MLLFNSWQFSYYTDACKPWQHFIVGFEPLTSMIWAYQLAQEQYPLTHETRFKHQTLHPRLRTPTKSSSLISWALEVMIKRVCLSQTSTAQLTRYLALLLHWNTSVNPNHENAWSSVVLDKRRDPLTTMHVNAVRFILQTFSDWELSKIICIKSNDEIEIYKLAFTFCVTLCFDKWELYDSFFRFLLIMLWYIWWFLYGRYLQKGFLCSLLFLSVIRWTTLVWRILRILQRIPVILRSIPI